MANTARQILTNEEVLLLAELEQLARLNETQRLLDSWLASNQPRNNIPYCKSYPKFTCNQGYSKVNYDNIL
jgi:hypothetical protein